MSNYTNAPACRLLATHCCACARPLLDAVSVNLGIGPDCRKKYMGKGSGHSEEARNEANKIVHQLALVVSGMKPEQIEGLSTEAVQAAYALGGTKAVGAMLAAASPEGSTMLDRLRTLGFDKLADKFEKNWCPVRITEVGQEIRLEAPYHEGAVAAQRDIKGRRWDKEAKANYFPISSKAAVWHMLTRFYAGMTGIGPKGPFVIGANSVTAPKAEAPAAVLVTPAPLGTAKEAISAAMADNVIYTEMQLAKLVTPRLEELRAQMPTAQADLAFVDEYMMLIDANNEKRERLNTEEDAREARKGYVANAIGMVWEA